MIDVSVIIVNYRTRDLTLDCIRSVYTHTQKCSFEIILVDNNSEDGIEQAIKEQFPEVIFVQTGYNSGFSRANNAGAKKASGTYILLLNSDTLLIEDTISDSKQFMDQHTDHSAIGVNMLNARLKENPVDPNFNLYGTLKYAFVLPDTALVRGYTEKKTEKLKASFVNRQEDYILGAYFFCRLSDFRNLGQMDENLFLYGEDIDLSCKFSTIGQLKTIKHHSIIHLEGGSTKSNNLPVTFFSRSPQMQLSNLYFIRKWFGIWAFLLIMLNYWLFVPVYFGIRLCRAIFKARQQELRAPVQFTRQTIRWSSYFFSILFLKEKFYKY
jgi:GT2 family glycosyltransferase